MIVVRPMGSYGIEYASLFADVFMQEISQISDREPYVQLPVARTASDLIKQNQLISSMSPTILFNIQCNFSTIDDTLRGYSIEANDYNPVVSALVAAFKNEGIKSIYPLGFKISSKLSAYVKISEITIGIGYASNELDIARFREDRFKQIVDYMLQYLYSAPIASNNRTPGIKNRDQYINNYKQGSADNYWHEYQPSVREGDSGDIIAASIGGIPVKVLKLTRAVQNLHPYYWYTSYNTSDLLYEHQVIFSVKVEKAPLNVVVYAGNTLRVITLTNTNWTMVKVSFKPQEIFNNTNSIKASIYVKSNNKRVKEDRDLPSSIIIDGLHNFKLGIGIQTSGTLLVTSVAVGLKEVLGKLDSIQSTYSIYPPETRPTSKPLIPNLDRALYKPNVYGDNVSVYDTGLTGTYGSAVDNSSPSVLKPTYTDSDVIDMGVGGGVGSGSGPLSQVYDSNRARSTLSEKAGLISPESNSGYLDELEDPSTLLTSDGVSFTNVMSTVLRAKMSTDLVNVPILSVDDFSGSFNYDALETAMASTDSPLISSTIAKTIGLIKSVEASVEVLDKLNNIKLKDDIHKQLLQDVSIKINNVVSSLQN